MDQRAALLWYHDHVMGVTKLDVYAGLAGLWIVRDERERELGLPEGPPFEVPLLVQDRNFDLDAGRAPDRAARPQDRPRGDGSVRRRSRSSTARSGRCSTVAAGDVPLPRAQRLERPHLPARARCATDEPELDRITQIGTDHGLLRDPRRPCRRTASCSRRPNAPTCSSTSPTSSRGRELTCSTRPRLPSTAPPIRPPTPSNAADLDGLLPYPAGDALPGRRGRPGSRVAIPRALADRLRAAFSGRRSPARRAARSRSSSASSRTRPNMLTMRELAPPHDEDAQGPLITFTDGEQTTRYRVVAAHFEDSDDLLPDARTSTRSGSSSTSPATRTRSTSTSTRSRSSLGSAIRYEIPEGGIEDRDLTATVTLERDPDDDLDHAIDDNERGPEGHDPRQPQRDRRDRRPLHHLQRAGTCTTATSSSTRTAT